MGHNTHLRKKNLAIHKLVKSMIGYTMQYIG